MNIGELKHRITIQKKAEKKPLEDTTYTDFKTVWTKINNLYGKEFIEAQKVEANISKKFIIRYIKDLDPSINPNTCKDFIITYRGISYNILYIDNIKEENKFMEVMAGVL